MLEFRHLDTCGSPCNKQYFPIRSFPPPLAEIGEPLSLVGFPGVLRKTSERSGSFSPVSIAYTISSVSERQIVLADQSGDRKVVGTQFSSTEEVPLGGFSGAEKLSGPDYLLDAKALAQAVAEIRALTGWLLEEGCPAVALWGISYGGWLAGLAVCREERLASVVLTVPKVHMNHHSIAEVVTWRRIREAMQGRQVAREMLILTPLNLTLVQPAIPKDSILLIEATQDLFLGKEPIEELWQPWGQPDIWRSPHGHVSVMGQPGLTGGVLRWLAPRLDKPAVPTGQTIIPQTTNL